MNFKSFINENTAFRYHHKDNNGLMNNSSLNYEKLDDDEYSEVEEGYLKLQQPPRDLHGQKLIFVFTPEGENEHIRLINLLGKASKKGVVRQILDLSKYDVVWNSGDGQLGLREKI